MKIAFKIKIFILFVIVLFLSGCAQQQLHQKLIVQGVAIDAKNDKYVVTEQALDFRNPKSENEPSVKNISSSGSSIGEALKNISKQTGLAPVYSQNLVLIIGEDAAKNGINKFMDFFVRHHETRPKVKIAIIKGLASDAFKSLPGDKFVKASDINELIPNSLNSDVMHFVSALKSGITDPWAALLDVNSGSEQVPITIKGAATFSGDNICKILQGYDAWGFMFLKGVPGFGACVVDLNNFGEVTCTADKVIVSVSVSVYDNLPVFDINVSADFSAFSMDEKKDFLFDDSSKDILADKLSERTAHICRNTVNKTVFSGSDAFGFGRVLRNTNPAYFKNINGNVSQALKNSEYHINVKPNISVTGKEPI